MHVERWVIRPSSRGLYGLALLATAVLLAPGEAQAQTPTDPRNQCGALASGAATCSGTAYNRGIRYDVTDGWANGVAGPVTLTVPGTATTTTITAPASPPNTYTDGAIVIRTAPQGTSDSTSRTVVLTVGSSSNAVAIVEDATETNHGIQIHQFGKAADATTVTVGSGVTIGTASAPMKQYGVFVLTTEGDNTAAHSIDSAATIHSVNFGLLMDARGAGNVVVKNSGSITTAATGGDAGQKSGIRVLDWSHNPGGNSFGGDSRTATTTTTVTNSGSVMVSAQYAHGIHVTADGLGLYKTVNSGTVSASGGSHGIFVEARYHTGAAGSEAVEVENSGAITAAGVTISAGVTTDVGGIGIYVETVDSATPAGRGIGNVKIANSGSVTARQSGIVVAANMGDISVTHSGAGTVSSSIADGIQIQRRGAGEVMVDSSADIAAGRYGIYVAAIDAPAAATTVSAGLTTKPFSTTTVIAAGMTSYTHDWPTATTVAAGTTTTTYATPGAISVTTTGGDIEATGESGIWVAQRGADATVTSSADITARKYGIFVINDPARATMAIADGVTTNTWSNTGAVSVTHSAGTISAETESGIHAQNAAGNADEVKVDVTGGSVSTEGQSKAAVAVLQRGTGDAVASVSSGAMLTSKHNAGIYADLDHAANAAGQVKITSGGTIAARKGVYARVGRASAMDETRAAMKQPVIDVTWTGGFSHGTTATVAGNDDDRFLANGVAHAVAVAQKVEAEKAMRPANRSVGTGFLRYGSPAGIEAQVMSWREVMTQVAKGDDPGAFADAAAVTALFDDSATDATKARAAAIIAAFRAALANDDLDTIPGAAAIDTDGTTGLSDDEIETYLSVDDADRRTLLRNVLAQDLSDEEKAVLRAVATNDGLTDVVLDAALPSDATMEQKTAYRTAVRALLERRNVGDIRIAMTGGSIAAPRGDGIRAYYATPHAMNGAISVTVAAGTTVSGGMAGIYVANAGTMGTGAERILKQSVTVNGMVTGGTDAAVHLVGGGRLTVGTMGKVHAGSSGTAILVNDPGRSEIVINGEVKGGEGARAAVDTTGGGTITVGRTGSVDASRGDGIRAYFATPNDANGAISVTVDDGATVTGGMAGIYVANAGLDRREAGDADDILKQSVTVNGMVTGGSDAAVHLVGGGSLTVGTMGKVHAGSSGRAILVNDPGRSEIIINGEVRGGSGSDADAVAAVETTGGGRITLGRTGRVVLAEGAANAIRAARVTGSDATTDIILVVDGTMVYRENADEAVARLGGAVVGNAVAENADGEKGVRFATADEDGTTGMVDKNLTLLNEDGTPDTSGISPAPKEPDTPKPDTPPMMMVCDMATDARCRLYEALPSVLLAMNDLPTWAERMSAARDGKGGWARVETAGGKWKADRSTESDVAWDHRRHGVRAGMDFAVGEGGRAGVSVHGLRGSAEMTKNGGEVELSGGGVGVNATAAMAGDVHVDAQAAVTWYDMDVESALRSSLKKGAGGMGYALGVEVGRRMPVADDVFLTPHGGLLWSKVDMDDFTDRRGTRVSVEDADSLRAALGVSVEKVLDGDGGSGSRLFGSLDVEQEFKEETAVKVQGSPLKASAEKTRFRLGIGGVHAWDEGRYALQGSLGYTARGGGGDNRDVGGGLSFVMRF